MDKNPNFILLTPDNLPKYGFVCFHQPGEPNIKDDFCIREIEMSVGGEEGSVVHRFKIQKELLIELPQKEKIVNSSNYKIGSSSSSEEIIKLLSERAGWNQTEADLKSIRVHGKDGVSIALYNNQNQNIVLGSGVSLPVNDALCWIGMILVHPELRRQGIARSIMNKCLEHARLQQHKKIIGLDATPLGKQVYDSLGFKDSFTIWRSVMSTSLDKKPFIGNSFEAYNFKSVYKYLKGKNYIERIKIIELLGRIPDSKNIMAISNSVINGFVMSRPGRLMPFVGPLIADSETVAICLLSKVLSYWCKLGFTQVFIDIPEQHLDGPVFQNLDKPINQLNQQIPVKPVRSLVRMYQLVTKDEFDTYSTVNKPSKGQIIMQYALDHLEETAAFMNKEKNDIIPIMYGTAGPEWS